MHVHTPKPKAWKREEFFRKQRNDEPPSDGMANDESDESVVSSSVGKCATKPKCDAKLKNNRQSYKKVPID